ncbi:MAG: SufD family Fe-S cluster assembly protein [Bacteroidales bacterium]|nr:SufD family Fe-S cluster assembly protein [Bacteroidales bacterium]
MTGSSIKANSPLTVLREEGDVRLDTSAPSRVSLRLGPDAAAAYLVLQDDASADRVETDFEIRLAAGSSLEMVFLSLRGEVLRNRIRVSLDGERASCSLSGLCLAGGSQQRDFDILLTHQVPACHSTQLFKSILGGGSVAHFDGLIKVVPDAQKTEAYQANHNLLVSDSARAHTRPQLEIYADDVKCSHGATVGRLNPDELFYMRSRGITLEEARLLQQLAFADEILEKIPVPEWQQRMRVLVEECLR